jgi:hypothetical protein
MVLKNSFLLFLENLINLSQMLDGTSPNVQIMSAISLLNGVVVVVVVESIDDTAAEGPFHLNANSF